MNLPVGFFQDYNPDVKEARQQLVKNLIKTNVNDQSILEEVFFSDDNIDIINKQLVLAVWKTSNKQFKINFQSRDKIIIVMRYVFIEHARHLPYDIKGQIHELNCSVINKIVPDLITNFEQKLGYLRDIERRGELPDQPKSSTSDRTLGVTNRIM
jgi:hypothetical protein